MKELLFLNSLFSPDPDLVIYFEVPVEEALKRLRKRGGGVSVFEEEEKLREVAGNYERVLGYFDVVRVNALFPVEELINEVEKIVVEFVSRRLE
jgi:thymidylate kinase